MLWCHPGTCVTEKSKLTTEWTETLEGGANRLVGARAETIVLAVRAIEKRPPVVKPGLIYGDGRAADRIARLIQRHLDR